MKIIICFKSGSQLVITCEEFTLKQNGLGEYTGYEISGIKDNKPLYIDWRDVSHIYRVMEGSE